MHKKKILVIVSRFFGSLNLWKFFLGLKKIMLLSTFGFGKKLVGFTSQIFLISNLQLEIIDNLE